MAAFHKMFVEAACLAKLSSRYSKAGGQKEQFVASSRRCRNIRRLNITAAFNLNATCIDDLVVRFQRELDQVYPIFAGALVRNNHG
jgi:hypothetical protein